MGCTSSRLSHPEDFNETSSYTKIPAMTAPRTGQRFTIPKPKARSIKPIKPTLSSTSSWMSTSSSTTSSTSATAPQHPSFHYERPRAHPLLRKTSSRLRVVLDNNDPDTTSPIATKARMPFDPASITQNPVRRFESLNRKPGRAIFTEHFGEDDDLERVISIGQMYSRLDRSDSDLSEMEVEAMVSASEYVNGNRGGKVWFATQ